MSHRNSRQTTPPPDTNLAVVYSGLSDGTVDTLDNHIKLSGNTDQLHPCLALM